ARRERHPLGEGVVERDRQSCRVGCRTEEAGTDQGDEAEGSFVVGVARIEVNEAALPGTGVRVDVDVVRTNRSDLAELADCRIEGLAGENLDVCADCEARGI